MKKRILTWITALIAVCCFFSLLVLPSSAETNYIDDRANMLTSAEKTEIEALLKSVSEKYNCPVVIVTENGQTDDTFEQFTIDYANNLDYQYNKAIVLGHFPDIRAYQIEIRGAEFPLSDVETAFYRIRDVVVGNLKNDNIPGAYKGFASESDDVLGYLINGKTVPEATKTKVRSPYPVVRNIIITAIVALIAGAAHVSKLKKQLKTVVQETRAANYVKADSLQLSMEKDIFLYTHTTRTARPKNTGSSGGGGFSSGGGRSSGGGGGGHY